MKARSVLLGPKASCRHETTLFHSDLTVLECQRKNEKRLMYTEQPKCHVNGTFQRSLFLQVLTALPPASRESILTCSKEKCVGVGRPCDWHTLLHLIRETKKMESGVLSQRQGRGIQEWGWGTCTINKHPMQVVLGSHFEKHLKGKSWCKMDVWRGGVVCFGFSGCLVNSNEFVLFCEERNSFIKWDRESSQEWEGSQ